MLKWTQEEWELEACQCCQSQAEEMGRPESASDLYCDEHPTVTGYDSDYAVSLYPEDRIHGINWHVSRWHDDA